MLALAIAINARDERLIPATISLCTLSKAYHVELVFSDGVAVIADPSGVRLDTRSYDYYKWTFVPLPNITPEQEAHIRHEAAIVVTEHPHYDWRGALLGWLGSSFDDRSRWYCSELVAFLLRDHFPAVRQYKWITPQRLWKIVADHIYLQYPEYLQVWMHHDHHHHASTTPVQTMERIRAQTRSSLLDRITHWRSRTAKSSRRMTMILTLVSILTIATAIYVWCK